MVISKFTGKMPVSLLWLVCWGIKLSIFEPTLLSPFQMSIWKCVGAFLIVTMTGGEKMSSMRKSCPIQSTNRAPVEKYVFSPQAIHIQKV